MGAGLSGREIKTARVGDITDIVDGRLAVQVRGEHQRLVPIRDKYTDLVWLALGCTTGDLFVTAQDRNAVYRTAAGLDRGRGEGLVLRRARSTWLLAHLVAGTHLAALRRVAGPLSANTLDALLKSVSISIGDSDALWEALPA